ncbi:MAG: UDP-N-acetylmuramoyl-L-alanine--D-glutamate ligase [Oligoflexia bacterium]|nr:UDP-N-acetylmuramoyl-L-alanine--D-glutamate ligase [Oligoflexia bacterium]
MKQFSSLKIAVYGLGISGLKTLELLHTINNKLIADALQPASLWVIDKGAPENWKNRNSPELTNILEAQMMNQEWPHTASILAQMDLIILAPGISKEIEALLLAIKRGVPIWSEIELAYQFTSDEKIIAVTGTNGKTTTVTMIEEMLTAAGIPHFIGGNIGLPFSAYANEKLKNQNKLPVIVLELSSFQLESIDRFRPNVAVLTNLSFSHQERYSTFDLYQRAKFNITKNQHTTDTLIYNQSNCEHFADRWPNKLSLNKIAFNTESAISYVKQHFALEHFSLPGAHNIENLFCAIQALSILGIEHAPIQNSINSFKGVHYRVEKINGNRQYTLFNDAKSTNIDATIHAINAVKNPGKALYLIFGGKPRDGGAGYVLDRLSLDDTAIAKIFLIGETTNELYAQLQHKFNVVRSYSIKDAISSIDNENNFTGIVLFSPGYPSFDQFDNYQHRGRSFEELFF